MMSVAEKSLRVLFGAVVCGAALLSTAGCGDSKEVVVEDEPMSAEDQQMLDMQKRMFQQQVQQTQQMNQQINQQQPQQPNGGQ